MVRAGVNRSFLKWAGGKSTSLKMINSAIGYIGGRLIEPFAGSAVVSLNIDALGYVIADVNTYLIALYRQLHIEGESFINYCRTFFVPENNTEEAYYRLRARFNEDLEPRESAALFLYLNRHTFNGLCRFNSSGGFNVPFGRYDTVDFPVKEMYFFLEKFRRVHTTFHCKDFEQTISLAQKNDVIYCDPPYVPLTGTASFTDYSTDGFDMWQQEKLARLAEQSECKFMISNHDTDITRELYRNADKIITRPVGRFVGASKESRKPVVELLAIYNI